MQMSLNNCHKYYRIQIIDRHAYRVETIKVIYYADTNCNTIDQILPPELRNLFFGTVSTVDTHWYGSFRRRGVLSSIRKQCGTYPYNTKRGILITLIGN